MIDFPLGSLFFLGAQLILRLDIEGRARTEVPNGIRLLEYL